MEDFRSSSDLVRFAGFQLDRQAGELRKDDGTKIRLQEQPLHILRILLEHPGRIIAREELRQKIWPSDTFVDFDHGINNAIKRLRETLGDTAETPSFIETLPRRGYRFIAPIEDPPSRLRSGLAPLDSIAILPFETASSDPDTDYAFWSQSTAKGRVQMFSVMVSRSAGMMRGSPSVPFRTSAFRNVPSGLPSETHGSCPF